MPTTCGDANDVQLTCVTLSGVDVAYIPATVCAMQAASIVEAFQGGGLGRLACS